MGDERGARRRLAQDRHSGEQRRRRFLAGAPGGEVERVDVHGDAVAGYPQVDARVPRRPTELDRLAVTEGVQGPELRAEVSVMRERGDGAVDVELGVGAGVAAVGDGEADELVARRVERLGPGPTQLASLSKTELAERRTAAGAGMLERLAKIDARSSGARKWLLRRRVDEGGESALSLDPAILDVAA